MRIYGYVAALLLLAALSAGAVHVWRKAERVDVAEANEKAAERRAADADKRAADVASAYSKARKDDVNTADELAKMRAAQLTVAAQFADALKAKPLTLEKTHVENGQTVTCRERNAARYYELFNSAVDGLNVPEASGP